MYYLNEKNHLHRHQLRRDQASLRGQGPGAVLLYGLLHALRGHGRGVRLSERRRYHCQGRRRLTEDRKVDLSQQSPKIVFRQYFNLSRLFCVFASTLKHDSLVDDHYLFEVGGPKKSFNQIKDVENSFLAIDGVEFGRGNKIPLWLFGFLY